MSPRLTLDYGMRFYMIQPQYDEDLQTANFLPSRYNPADAPRLFQPAKNAAGTRVAFVAGDPHNDAITVHRGAGIFRGDKNVRFIQFFCDEKTVTGLMDRQFASNKIGLGWQYITILPNARDFAVALQFTEDLIECHPYAALASQLFRQLALVERPIIFAS